MTIYPSVRLGIHTEQAETVVGTVPGECLKTITGEWSVSGIPLRAENGAGVGLGILSESEVHAPSTGLRPPSPPILGAIAWT